MVLVTSRPVPGFPPPVCTPVEVPPVTSPTVFTLQSPLLNTESENVMSACAAPTNSRDAATPKDLREYRMLLSLRLLPPRNGGAAGVYTNSDDALEHLALVRFLRVAGGAARRGGESPD